MISINEMVTVVSGLLTVSVFFGIILSRSKSKFDIVKELVTSLNDLFMKMIFCVMWYVGLAS